MCTDDRVGDERPDPGHRHQPAGGRVGLGLGRDAPVEPLDLVVERRPLPGERREPFVEELGDGDLVGGDRGAQVRPAARALALRDAELAGEAADRLHERAALAHEQVAHAVEAAPGLLRLGLDRDEAHGRARDRLADRLGVARVGLVALDVGLHVLRRHRPHLVPEPGQEPPPVVRRPAGLHPDERGRMAAEEAFDLMAPQLALHHHGAGRVDAVHLENRFGDVEADRDSVHKDGLLSWLNDAPAWHKRCRRGPFTPTFPVAKRARSPDPQRFSRARSRARSARVPMRMRAIPSAMQRATI